MDILKGYKGSKGCTGPIAICPGSGLTGLVDFAKYKFRVKETDILIGRRRVPPDVEWCKVYIYYTEASAEFFIRRNGEFVNWNYL